MELKNLRREIKKFGDMGKLTVMLPSLAQYAGQVVEFDIIIKGVVTETANETVTKTVK